MAKTSCPIGIVLTLTVLVLSQGVVAQEQPFTTRPTGSSAGVHLFKIGVLLPLSGKRRRLGEAVLEAISLAQVETGGPRLVVVDTKGTVDGARAAVSQLAADPSVVILLGPIGWRVAAAAGQRAEQLGITLVGLAAQEGLEDQGRYVFRGRTSVEEQARLMAQLGVKELGIRRFAVLAPDDALGQRAARSFFERVRALDGRVTAWSTYVAGDTNFTTSVEELVGKRLWTLSSHKLSQNPRALAKLRRDRASVDFDAVFIPDYDDGVVLAVKFLRFHDVPLATESGVQILGTGHLHGVRLPEAEGLLAGALYPEMFQAGRGSRFAQAWALRFQEEYERPPRALDAHVYDLYALLAAVAVAGQTKMGGRGGVRRQIPDLLVAMEPRTGVSGLRWFEPGGRVGHRMEVWVVDAAGGVSPSF
jgi:ABC-type branched-subunit amino acid transport system substrate-binding protein